MNLIELGFSVGNRKSVDSPNFCTIWRVNSDFYLLRFYLFYSSFIYSQLLYFQIPNNYIFNVFKIFNNHIFQ